MKPDTPYTFCFLSLRNGFLEIITLVRMEIETNILENVHGFVEVVEKHNSSEIGLGFELDIIVIC